MAPLCLSFSSSTIPLAFSWSRKIAIRRCPPCSASSDQGDLVGNVKKFLGDVQGRLPVIGLLSRLMTPEGGIGTEDLSYPEFGRLMMEKSLADDPFIVAFYALETEKDADWKYVLFVIWMLKFGIGLVPGKDMVLSATRLRVTKDLEIEIERFEATRDNELKKYMYMERPQPSGRVTATTGIDALCRLILGKSEGKEVPQEDAKLIIDLLQAQFPSIPSDVWAKTFETRSERVSEYI